VPQT
jgi:hypothetical protein